MAPNQLPRSHRPASHVVAALLLAVGALALTAPFAAAQNIGRTTGVVTGVVTDESGGVLPGVTLTASGRALVGTATAVSDGAGVFNLQGLPAGTYRIAADLQGFAASVADNVDLKVGDTLKINFTLKVGGLETVVQVEAPLISAVTTERGQDFSAKQFDELPKGRTWETLVEQAPSINTESLAGQTGLSFQGASVNENVYIVDGVDTTRATTGSTGQPVLFEFVDTIQVKSGFVGAEYGGALGGIVNVTTKSGANTFNGFASLQYSGSALTGDPRSRLRVNPVNSTQSQYIQDPKDTLSVLGLGGAVGGPVRKDRLWFYAGYMPTLTDTTRQVTFTPSGQTGSYKNEDRKHFATGKLTLRLADGAKLNAGIQRMPFRSLGVLPSYDGTEAPNQPFATLGNETPQNTYSVTGDFVLSPKVFVNAFVGYLDQRSHDLGIPNADRYRFVTTNIGQAGVPAQFQGPANFETFGNNIRTDKSDTTRLNLGAVATVAFNAAGIHTFKAGLQFASQDWVRLGGYTGKRVDLHWNTSFSGQRGTYGYWRAWDNSSDGKSSSTNLAMFAQDAWSLGQRVTVNAGLRFEREVVKPFRKPEDTATGDIVFGYGDKLAPRLGLAWDVRGNASWKIYANGGLFYDTLKLSLPGQVFGGAIFRIRYYTLDTYEWQTLDPGNPVGRLLFTQDLQGLPATLDPTLKPTRTSEYAFGTEYQLARDVVLGVQFSHRGLSNAVENTIIGDPRGTTRVTAVANAGMGITQYPFGTAFPAMPTFERNYNGLEMLLEKRLSHNWLASTSYTYSRLEGNYEGLGDSDEQAFGGSAVNANRYCDYLEGCFTASGAVDKGPLTLDRPHQFKLNGSYRLPGGLSVGGFFRAASGTIVTRQIGVNSASPVHPEGRGSDGRLPMLSQTDLLVQWRVPTPGRFKATASLNVLNVWNQDTITSRFPGMLLGTSVGIKVDPALWFAGNVDYKAAIAASGSALDPRFLLAQAYQPPRALRIGVRFDF